MMVWRVQPARLLPGVGNHPAGAVRRWIAAAATAALLAKSVLLSACHLATTTETMFQAHTTFRTPSPASESAAAAKATAVVAAIRSDASDTRAADVVETLANARNPSGGKFPGSRDPDTLLIYDPAYGVRTGTNPWGVEAVIADGLVTRVGGNDSAIPAEGVVLSGHGRGKDWILKHVLPGDEVKVNGLTITRCRTWKSNLWRAVYLTEVSCGIRLDGDRLLSMTALFTAVETEIAKAVDAAQSGRKGFTDHVENALLLAEELHYGTCPSRTPEGRGIWVRLEPSGRTGVEELVSTLASANFNLILPETVYYGRTIYPAASNSPLQQWPEFAGTDPLKSLIDAAHARGMEVHAWVHVFFVGFDSSPLVTKYTEWLAVDRQGRTASVNEPGYYYFQPSNPEAREFLLRVFEDLVRRYDVDGLQLDYIRYPYTPNDAESGYDYARSTRRQFVESGGGYADPQMLDPDSSPAEWEAWCRFRMEAVTSFVGEAHRRLLAIRPDLKLSAAVFPDLTATRRDKMQDWQPWLQAGWLDFVSPMAYTTDATEVESASREMRSEGPGSGSSATTPSAPTARVPGPGWAVFTGLGPFLGLTPGMLVEQVEAARRGGADGVVLFCHNEMTDSQYRALRAGAFEKPAGAVPLGSSRSHD